jgi:DMSO/TMAO reductase YedYZ molybdopterin-dependent catalytic subunit
MTCTDVPQGVQRRLPPGQKWIDRILRWNIDHPGIVPENPRVDLESWRLTVDGEVDIPTVISWRDLLSLPSHESISDFHCVEGWSVPNRRWLGVKFSTLAELVKPKPEARHVFFTCMDGYTTCLALTDLLEDDVILAYKHEGEYLDVSLGAPLRLVVPNKYAYKSAMWIERITFMKTGRLGYWEQRGYSDTADVWRNDRYAK